MYSLLEAASNFSDFFFRFHFQGLKSLPNAENLDLVLSAGGVRAPEPRLFVRTAEPFCFLAVLEKNMLNIVYRTNSSIIIVLKVVVIV